jgi:hypothetical protein
MRVASLAISVVPARTLRSPTADIGTELLANREKIEVTRRDSTCVLSPVPVRRHIVPTSGLFAVIPGECSKAETRWRREVNSNSRYRCIKLLSDDNVVL